ncbi:MAG: translation initiation factor IF-2 [candidate division Zixibacteria bacterium]|nr:translation initiation factor IF-2 [candidate division Zixibacteria bacterium]
MAKKRIYEIAKDYNVSSDALMSLLKEHKFKIKSHMSSVTDEMLTAIEQKFAREKEIVKKEISEKKQRQIEREKKPIFEKPAAKAVLPAQETAEIPELSEEAKFERLEEEKRQAAKKVKPKPWAETRQGDRVSQKLTKENVRKTLSRIDESKRKRYYKKESEAPVAPDQTKTIKVSEFISVAELATLMNLRPAQVIAKCMELGMMANINQRLDMHSIETVALEFGFAVEKEQEPGMEREDVSVISENLAPRPAIVTIMGHVDHGKTSLLDYIRKSNIIAGESGGITQHIGAYEVQLPKGNITFLDTPGHEAFTAMRARGVQITDIVVLVVAADSQVMPQTIEAIDHARAASVPIIVAINKIDLPKANPDMVKQQLGKYNLQPEEWGGKTIMVELSARTGKNVDRLLEMIILQTDMMELKADPTALARGTIVEARLDRGKGPLITVLVQKGTLRLGEPFVTGSYFGKVRAMFNERGQAIQKAEPSMPAQVLGSSGVPQAGERLVVLETELEARDLANKRTRLKREHQLRLGQSIALEEVYQKVKEGAIKELKLVIKGDVDGSVEVLSDTLEKMSTHEVKVTVIHKGVGAVNESDILLAAASQAIIIGFHVRPEPRARDLAEQQKVDIRIYNIIYEAQNEIKKALEGLLEPELKETIQSLSEVREIFKVSKVGLIAGCQVQKGTVRMGDQIRVVRDAQEIYKGKIGSLRRFKEDVREVSNGMECGIRIENFADVKVGDLLETFQIVELERKLEQIPK